VIVTAAKKEGNKLQGTRELEPGNWYFGFDCLTCNRPFAVFDDNAGSVHALEFFGGAAYRITCPHCQDDRMYFLDQIKQFRAVNRSSVEHDLQEK
jgi:hypothetical protein